MTEPDPYAGVDGHIDEEIAREVGLTVQQVEDVPHHGARRL